MKLKISVIFLTIFFVSCLEAANLLCIYLMPSYSHLQVFNVLTIDLLARGHHLTVLTTRPMKSDNENLTKIDASISFESNPKDFSKLKGTEMFNFILDFLPYLHDTQFQIDGVRDLIENKDNRTFDLVIVEHLLSLPWFAFAKKFNAPLITIKSSDGLIDAHAAMGNVINPVIHPEVSLHISPPLSFFERWKTLKFHLFNELYYQPTIDAITNKVLKQYLPDIDTTAQQLRGSSQLLLVNAHPVLDFVRPVVPTTIQLGFMHIEQPKALPDDLKNYLDSSEFGVIYMSLGTNVKSSLLGEEKLNSIKETFKRLKYNVLWKFETDDIKDLSDNVRVLKWFPQADLLYHPKIKLFITQGGQQSLEEAISSGVPLIAIPFISDQYSNAHKISKLKIGAYLDISDLTVETLKAKIDEVLKTEYKKNIEKLRDLIYDQPMSSREKAVWWVEYVLRHKTTDHLDYIGRHIPFYQKYFLDFIGIAGLFLISIFILIKFSFEKFRFNIVATDKKRN